MLRELLRHERTPGLLVVYGVGLLSLFAGMRSGIELVLMSYALLAWVGLVWAYQRLFSSASRQSPIV